MHIFKGFPHVSVNLRLTAGKVIERKSVGGGDNSKYFYKIVKYFFWKKNIDPSKLSSKKIEKLLSINLKTTILIHIWSKNK